MKTQDPKKETYSRHTFQPKLGLMTAQQPRPEAANDPELLTAVQALQVNLTLTPGLQKAFWRSPEVLCERLSFNQIMASKCAFQIAECFDPLVERVTDKVVYEVAVTIPAALVAHCISSAKGEVDYHCFYSFVSSYRRHSRAQDEPSYVDLLFKEVWSNAGIAYYSQG